MFATSASIRTVLEFGPVRGREGDEEEVDVSAGFVAELTGKDYMSGRSRGMDGHSVSGRKAGIDVSIVACFVHINTKKTSRNEVPQPSRISVGIVCIPSVHAVTVLCVYQ